MSITWVINAISLLIYKMKATMDTNMPHLYHVLGRNTLFSSGITK